MIKIKTYYIKQGKTKIFKKININGKYCEILKRLEKQSNVNQIIQQMIKNDVEIAILSKELYENKEFIKQLTNNRIKVLDGKWLYKYIVPDIVEYICKKANIDNNIEIGMLTNEATDEFLGNIKLLSTRFKKTKIVTEHPEKFRKIEQRELEDSGFSMIISQNKKQALTKSKIIINFDLQEGIINQYNINENAIIINLNEDIKINKKRFNGIIVSDYEIKSTSHKEEIGENQNSIIEKTEKDKEDIDKEDFYIKHIKESKIYEKSLSEKRLEEASLSKFCIVRRIIEEEQIQIKELYGKNGSVL
ncbi:MAG: hypothetical protein HFJ48_03110 [Clostridia bacterium]|nr:hypothetical protein [Clostridia bacterium]